MKAPLRPSQRIALGELRRQVETGERRFQRQIVRHLAWRHYGTRLVASWAGAFVAGVGLGLVLG